MYLGKPFFQFSFQVVDIMRVNVDKVLERDQKLSELDDRAGKFIFINFHTTFYFFVRKSVKRCLKGLRYHGSFMSKFEWWMSSCPGFKCRCAASRRLTVRGERRQVEEQILVEKLQGLLPIRGQPTAPCHCYEITSRCRRYYCRECVRIRN